MTRLAWRCDGDGWILLAGRHRFGRVVPDATCAGMWRVQWPDGSLSDMANLTRAKDALARSAGAAERRGRERAAEARRGSPVRFSEQAATTLSASNNQAL